MFSVTFVTLGTLILFNSTNVRIHPLNSGFHHIYSGFLDYAHYIGITKYKIMKKLLFTLALFITSFAGFTQLNFDAIPDEAYEEIPAMSKKFKIEDNGLKCGRVVFQYYPEYEYKNSIAFGSVCRVVMDQITGLQKTEDGTFAMGRHQVKRKSDGVVVMEEGWKFVNGGAAFPEGEGDSKQVDLPIYIGRPMYSGTYIIEMEIKDLCSGNSTKTIATFDIGPSPSITTTAKGGASFSEIFLFSVPQSTIVLDGRAKVGNFKMLFDEIEGFTLEEGYYSIGLEMILTDVKNGEELLHIEDAISENGGAFKKEGPFMLDPYAELSSQVLGTDIKFYVRIWDKKGKAEITGTTTFTVVE